MRLCRLLLWGQGLACGRLRRHGNALGRQVCAGCAILHQPVLGRLHFRAEDRAVRQLLVGVYLLVELANAGLDRGHFLDVLLLGGRSLFGSQLFGRHLARHFLAFELHWPHRTGSLGLLAGHAEVQFLHVLEHLTDCLLRVGNAKISIARDVDDDVVFLPLVGWEAREDSSARLLAG